MASLNVIVPCYNPPANWEAALAERFKKFCDQVPSGLQPRLIVVNDGSPRNVTDTNLAHLTALIPTVLIVSYAENRGKGYALRQGVQAATADYYLVTDADFPYELESMRRVLETLATKGGIAAGNRDTSYYERVPAFRRILSKSLRWMLRHVLRQPIDDSQCGLKAFDNSGKDIFLQTTIDRFLFDLEFLMLANGRIPVTPVTVNLREGVIFSQVGYRILMTEGRNFLKLLIRQPRK